MNAANRRQKLSFFNFIFKAPAIFFSPITLDTAVLSHIMEQHFFLAYFDCLNILIQWQSPSSSITSLLSTVEPYGGELIIPEEYRRWQIIPSGIWKLFSAISQASENFDIARSASKCKQGIESRPEAATSNDVGFVYPPENTIFLDEDVTVFAFQVLFH